MSGLWLGYKVSFLKNNNNKKKISAARERARQHDELEEKATKHRAENYFYIEKSLNAGIFVYA